MTTERLSATDRAFLAIEEGALRMHVAVTMVLDGADFVAPDGALDAERLTAQIASSLDAVPRFRQRVHEVPGVGAVWEDDPHFRVERHVVHTALPRPGDDAALMRLVGRLLAQPLDRRRPLWEIWLVEGLSAGRFAIVAKAHHAMVDGIAGLGLLASMLRVEPGDAEVVRPSHAPAPTQGTGRIAASLVAEGARGLLAALNDARGALSHPGDALHRARDLGEGLAETLRDGLTPAAPTSINPTEVGPHRSFLGMRFPMARLHEARRALGATVNEFVVALTTSALRRYLAGRGDDVDAMETFRALVPVNLRPRYNEPAGTGNRISLVLMPLPVRLGDARARVDAVKAACAHFKHASHEVEGAELVERIGDLGGPNIVSLIFRTAAKLRAFNVVVTNVPGVPFPLYLGRARVLGMWGEVPLFAHQGLGVAALSYDDALSVGLHADPDALPDLQALARDFDVAFEELCALGA